MSAKVLFSLWLCIDGAFGFLMAINYLREKKPKNQMNAAVFLICLASGIWSVGFGLMYPQATEHGAYICRSFAIFGTFLFMMASQTIISDIAGLPRKSQTIVNGISYLGVFLYIATIQPGQTSYKMTELGMTYQFAPGIVNVLYTGYFVLVSLNILIITFWMIKFGKTRKVKTFGKQFLFVSIFVIGGTIFDMVFPALGYSALPGSNITQFWGLIVIWNAVHAINKNEITLANMTEYIYYSLDIPVIVFDTEKSIRIMNSAAAEYFRVEPEMVERNNYKVSSFFDTGNEIFEFEGKSQASTANCIANGINSQLAISKIVDKYEDVIGYIVMINDMTEQDRTIRKLENARRVSDAANQSKSEFFASMSHEIRTPMSSILGFADLALNEKGIDPVAREYVEDIKESAENLLSIINDVMNISKIEAGRTEIVNSQYRPAKIFAEIENQIVVKAAEKKLDFEVKVEDEFPDKLEGDREKLQEVLITLLTNSIKHTEMGRVGLHASVIEKKDGVAKVCFKVTDTGVGIKVEDRDKIFEKFDGIEKNGTNTNEGSGLGLAIAKGYIEEMKGDISFESVVGLGTAFTIIVDQKIIDDSPIVMEKQKTSSFDETKHMLTKMKLKFRDIKALSVDDNKINLKVISKTFDQYGIKYDLVESGAESIEMCKNNSYDLVFMDQMMPEMDGVEAMKHIRDLGGPYAKGGSTKIIALTANVIEGIEETLINEGFDAYIGKPINFGIFEESLCSLIPEEKYYFEDEKSEKDNKNLEQPQEIIEETKSEQVNKNEQEPKEVQEEKQESEVKSDVTEKPAEKEAAKPEKITTSDPAVIDFEKGLDNFGGDEESYKEILSFVVETAEDDLDELLGLYDDSNYGDFTIKVHGMKSQCYYVGGMNIGDEAKALEFAGKEDRISFIDENVNQFTFDYRKFIDTAKNYLGN